MGTNETKASLNAIRRINLQNGKVGTFMKESKSQIVEYYNKQLPTILKEVKVKSSMKNYEEALAMLAVILHVVTDMIWLWMRPRIFIYYTEILISFLN